jgi:hypothetical protein
VLNDLGFHLSVPTTKTFLRYLLRMTRHIIFLFHCEVPVPSLTTLSCNLKFYQEIP